MPRLSRTKHLYRDLAIVPLVVGQVDRSHAAGPQLTFDRIAIGEGRLENEELRRELGVTHERKIRGYRGVRGRRLSPRACSMRSVGRVCIGFHSLE